MKMQTSATSTPAMKQQPQVMKEDEKPEAVLSALSLSQKIPDFWEDQPRVWFIRTEAILAPQKMGEDNKFNVVVSKLTKDAIVQVTDLLFQPPENKYEALKTRLLQIYEESESRQVQKLIGEMELGEQKPSQLLRRMRELARGKIPDETLRILWQGHLPQSARAVLAVTETLDLDNLSVIADKIVETTRPVQVAETQVYSGQTSTSGTHEQILAEIAKLSVRLNNMERGRSAQRGNRDRGRQRSCSRNPKSPDWLCFYHYRFKTRAQKCVQPCAWKVPGN